MSRDSNNTSAGPGQIALADVAQQFEIWEQLPLALREVIEQAPVSMDLREVLAVAQLYGQHSARQLILEVLTESYPGWAFRPSECQPVRRRRRPRA